MNRDANLLPVESTRRDVVRDVREDCLPRRKLRRRLELQELRKRAPEAARVEDEVRLDAAHLAALHVARGERAATRGIRLADGGDLHLVADLDALLLRLVR